MLQLDSQSKILFFHKPINMHKGIDALVYIVHEELGLELIPNLFILFANKRKNRIKIIYHNGDHLLMLATRFSKALKFTPAEGVVFDQFSFYEFINTFNSRQYLGKYRNI